MLDIRLGKAEATTITVYNTIEELPIKRYINLQKYSLLDSCVGSTFADVTKHFEKIDYFLEHKKINDAKRERENQHLGMYLQVEKMSTKMLSFACLVKNVNGVECIDLTEDGLQKTSERLQETELTIGKINELLIGVKKKLIGI